METSRSSATRKLFQILIASAIQRCRLSGILCRLTISLKGFYDAHPPSVRISISDTGAGSNLVEFRDLNSGSVPIPAEKWGIHENDIHRYCLNLKELHGSRKRLKSGTEVSLSSAEEESIDEFVKWVVGFVQKIRILKIPDIVIELLVEHINNHGSRSESFLQEINDFSSPIPVSNINHLVSGLEDYVLGDGNGLTDNRQSCIKNRASLMVGTGQTNNMDNNRGMIQMVEAVVMITPMPTCSCCRKTNCSATQVLYFQDFSPSSIPQSSLNALTNIDWQNHLTEVTAPESQHRASSSSKRNLMKNAIKLALDDLKRKHTAELLSLHAQQVREYVPDLSRTIASLIFSSNDLGFQEECTALLGLHSVDNKTEEKAESIIKEMITGIIEMKDRNLKRKKEDTAHCLLFECESHLEEECPDEDYREEPEDTAIIDF
ncbi:hypothetical protein J5N97_027994 [Dioscorea zingiberensis]|uniref:Uncharacterized protein n=1 Tax=Dioscorea zingiberensis TaxID=325984 RepID=A0A9D5BXQ3_9LILI|nr:hypothetical protein J5N97_027994 [Dioscorea zingiberensis]